MRGKPARNKYIQLAVERIRPNPDQPRRIFEPTALESLAQSIRENGVLQPITVQCAPGGQYTLVAGERRLRAAKLAGLSTIPAIVLEATPEDSAVLAILENLQRRDLKVFEEVYALYRLLKKWNIPQEQAARRLGMSQSALANKLRLLKLTEEEQYQITLHNLSERHARVLLRLPEGEARTALLREMIDKGMTVQEAEEAAARRLEQEALPRGEKKARRVRRAPKDVRLCVNTFDRAVAAMQTAGVAAVTEKSETSEFIICTVKIPKAV